MNDERSVLINALIRNKSYLELVLNDNPSRILKSAVASKKARTNGNKLFVRKNHETQSHREIFSYYAESIALALSDSEELAFAYGNMSVLLLHIGQYKECLVDIEKAYRITSNRNLKVKLLCRKVECWKKLGIAKYQNALDAAENNLNKIDDKNKDKAHLANRFNKVKQLSISQNHELKKEYYRNEVVNTLSKRDEILNNIRIECNKKFGRHLVANRDYDVGDVIFIEKLYAGTISKAKRYTNCHHCLKNCSSIVPCNNCSLAIFCSENCQQKAWELYHNIECYIVPHIENTDFFNFFHICLRILIIGLKEAGSISELKYNLLSVDTCADTSFKGFFKDGKFVSNSMQSIYSLTLDNSMSNYFLNDIAKDVITVLIYLATYNLLIENCYLKEVEDILKNEDLIFLGSLLIKLCKIISNNAYNISNFIHACELSSPTHICTANKCCARGSGLAPLLSLMNHSCFPNAEKSFAEDQKVVVYALQPIKKNSQIFISYSTSYYHVSFKSRQNFLKKYGFNCDCQACIESWPEFLMPIKLSMEKTVSIFQNNFEMNLYKDCEHIFQALDSKNRFFNKDTIKKLSGAYVKAWKNLKQPSLLMCYLTEALRAVFSATYGFKLQSFVECKDKNE